MYIEKLPITVLCRYNVRSVLPSLGYHRVLSRITHRLAVWSADSNTTL
ncbi:hypothetical protein SAMN05660226_00320 [Parapedobacter luteus]|uniref:Uncharacterized protein n=1 Tax=Parapedobacter luteus TaxID=623280 RepID=A0A1T4ZYZ3_9SPHI|nr:hypothetical protein SAMN05660226_00320 [Parapedobacter luteus]